VHQFTFLLENVGVAAGTLFCFQESAPIINSTFWTFLVGKYFTLLVVVRFIFPAFSLLLIMHNIKRSSYGNRFYSEIAASHLTTGGSPQKQLKLE